MPEPGACTQTAACTRSSVSLWADQREPTKAQLSPLAQQQQQYRYPLPSPHPLPNVLFEAVQVIPVRSHGCLLVTHGKAVLSALQVVGIWPGRCVLRENTLICHVSGVTGPRAKGHVVKKIKRCLVGPLPRERDRIKPASLSPYASRAQPPWLVGLWVEVEDKQVLGLVHGRGKVTAQRLTERAANRQTHQAGSQLASRQQTRSGKASNCSLPPVTSYVALRY